ncbi:biliverdin-producing heme oxygenase [Acidovorax sp. A1169]|uniref:biliverdin-producing heme oxygenase n=1 Tax=Acidovorax sp. A1169 TaxID=3059524 RepID=UPI00352085F0
MGDTDASIGALPRCADLPPLTNPALLWGCLYVIEGATLGGPMIIKNLSLNLGLTVASGASFFDGYGAQTGSRWKAFCAAVPGEDVDSHGGAEAMLCSANLTFDVFSEWLFPGSVTTPGRDFIEAGCRSPPESPACACQRPRLLRRCRHETAKPGTGFVEQTHAQVRVPGRDGTRRSLG